MSPLKLVQINKPQRNNSFNLCNYSIMESLILLGGHSGNPEIFNVLIFKQQPQIPDMSVSLSLSVPSSR